MPQIDLLFTIAIAFILGNLLFIFNDAAFLANSTHALIILIFAISGFIIFYNSYIRNFYLTSAIILIGAFYCLFYDINFINHNEIKNKIYVIAHGKVLSLSKYQNNRNNSKGIKVTLQNIILEKSPYSANKNSTKKTLTKKTSSSKISQNKIIKKFINVKNYQAIDRQSQDRQKKYQNIEWQKIDNKIIYPDPPKKISFIIRDNYLSENIAINDIISFKAMIENDYKKEFPDDFDINIYNKSKKIGGFGIAIGNVKIIERNKINNIDSWFLQLRDKISQRIIKILPQNQSSIALALLVGDKSHIADKNMEHIRNAGLAHLLSISGFHMALAGAIFFTITRFLLSRNEYITLNYDIKKISAIFALIACYFYLKISGESIPAQRAFLVIFLTFFAFLLSKKINLIRLLAVIALTIAISNPYNVASIGFSLSFIAVFTIITICNNNKIENHLKSKWNTSIIYIKNILSTSIAIQIITIPFLLHAFGKFSILSPIANILAIPLTSFIIMPLGFLSLFLMPLQIDKYILLLMGQGIDIIIYIAQEISNIKYSYLSTAKLPGFALLISFFGIILISLKGKIFKIIGLIIFLLPMIKIINHQQYDIAFDNEQKFFAIYNKDNGLYFSKKLRESKQRTRWLEYFLENEFKYLTHCKNSCIIDIKGKKFYILTSRNKITKICQQKDYDIIVNLNPNYKLPECVQNKEKIDNIDFYQKGGHFIKIKNDKLIIDYTKWQ